jgi:hypothetical protein
LALGLLLYVAAAAILAAALLAHYRRLSWRHFGEATLALALAPLYLLVILAGAAIAALGAAKRRRLG